MAALQAVMHMSAAKLGRKLAGAAGRLECNQDGHGRQARARCHHCCVSASQARADGRGWRGVRAALEADSGAPGSAGRRLGMARGANRSRECFDQPHTHRANAANTLEPGTAIVRVGIARVRALGFAILQPT